MENEAIEIENHVDDETIVEDVNTEEPENTDNSEVETDEETTLSNDDEQDEDGENENFLGTFKTKEEADKGFKNLQAKLTEQANKIKELEGAAQKQNDNILSEETIKRRVGAVKQNVLSEYNHRLQGLGYKYGSYIPNDAVINNENDIIKYLPSEQAAQFTAELFNLQGEFHAKLQNQTNAIYSEVNKTYEENKAKDKERYKDNEVVFNAWYNPPETIDQVAELVENVKKQAIENYIKEQAAKKEDTDHKSKLNTTANTKTKFKSDHVFTSAEIGKMSDSEFAKYEEVMGKQIAAGLVV